MTYTRYMARAVSLIRLRKKTLIINNQSQPYYVCMYPPLSNTQRPGAVAYLMLEEFEARETEELEGRRVTTITVASHKTTSSGAAVLRLDANLDRQLGQWVQHLRPGFLPAECPWSLPP